MANDINDPWAAGTDPMTHTPGPWKAFITDDDWRPGIDANGFAIVLIGDKDDPHDDGGVRGRTNEEAVANAKLMAAAKELLAALRAMMPDGWADDDTMDHMPGVKLARVAIARAEGKTP